MGEPASVAQCAKRQVIGAGSIPPLLDFYHARDDAGQQGDRLFSTATQQERVSGWGTITKEKSLYDWSKTNLLLLWL